MLNSNSTRKLNILHFHFLALMSRQRAALSSATLHASLEKSGGKWWMECFNTKFLLHTLLKKHLKIIVQIISILKISRQHARYEQPRHATRVNERVKLTCKLALLNSNLNGNLELQVTDRWLPVVGNSTFYAYINLHGR